MSDQVRRELERAWRASGATSDLAALLRECVRCGQLRPDDLALAAYLGDAAARAATSETLEPQVALKAWVIGLGRWGKATAVQASVAAARHALLSGWQFIARGRSEANAAIEAAEAWIACPCKQHAMQADAASEAVYPFRAGTEAASAMHAAEAASTSSTKLASGIAGDGAEAAAAYLPEDVGVRTAIVRALLPDLIKDLGGPGSRPSSATPDG